MLLEPRFRYGWRFQLMFYGSVNIQSVPRLLDWKVSGLKEQKKIKSKLNHRPVLTKQKKPLYYRYIIHRYLVDTTLPAIVDLAFMLNKVVSNQLKVTNVIMVNHLIEYCAFQNIIYYWE